NTVPLPPAPPFTAVPYSMLPDKHNSALGRAPSLLVRGGVDQDPESAVKLYRAAKPLPSVLTLNTVPWPERPPPDAVPYNVLPDKIKPPFGLAPSLFVGEFVEAYAAKLCKVLNSVPSILTLKTVPWPKLPYTD